MEEIYKKWWYKYESCSQEKCEGCEIDCEYDWEKYKELIKPILSYKRSLWIEKLKKKIKKEQFRYSAQGDITDKVVFFAIEDVLAIIQK